MKSTKSIVLVLLILSAAMASGSALARGRGHFGFYVGAPLFWSAPYYASPYYSAPYYSPYYSPAVVVPAAPPAYVEQSGMQTAPAPAPQNNWWYYCADAKAYYPYVRECPAGWQRVAPQPSS